MSREFEMKLLDVDSKQDMDKVLFLSLLSPLFRESKGFNTPSNINLGWCYPEIEELMADVRLVHVRSEKVRSEMRTQVQEAVKQGELVDNEELINALTLESELQAAAERERTVFYSLKDKCLGVTNVKHGSYGTVERSEWEVLRHGGLPLIHIHTHPDDTLFSKSDYITLITKLDSVIDVTHPIRERVNNALLVCGESIQVLSLATKDTVLIPYEEAEAFMDNWAESSGMREDFKELNAISASLDDDLFSIISTNPPHFAKLLNETREQLL